LGRGWMPAAGGVKPVGTVSQQQRVRALVAQQRYLGLDPARRRKAAEATGADDAVAWDDDRDRVSAAGLADGLRRRADLAGDLAIFARAAIGDRAHGGRYPALQRVARRPERQVEALQPAGEIGRKLALGLEQQGRLVSARPPPVEPRDRTVLLGDAKPAKRRFDRPRWQRRLL